jgi:hypothetical protein
MAVGAGGVIQSGGQAFVLVLVLVLVLEIPTHNPVFERCCGSQSRAPSATRCDLERWSFLVRSRVPLSPMGLKFEDDDENDDEDEVPTTLNQTLVRGGAARAHFIRVHPWLKQSLALRNEPGSGWVLGHFDLLVERASSRADSSGASSHQNAPTTWGCGRSLFRWMRLN